MARHTTHPKRLLGLALAAGLILSSPVLADDEGRYGYFSVVEGSATVTQDGERSEVESNYPLMTGDQLWTSYGSRVEAILPDSTLVRVDGNTVLAFDRLAFAADHSSDGTLLYLDKGEILVTVPHDAVGAAQTRVDTPNSTIYLVEPGTYRLESRGYVSTVTVREGSAELLTRDDSSLVRQRERASITGLDRPRVRIDWAGGSDSLERWGAELDRLAAGGYGGPEVDRSLRYASASLQRHGSWHVESSVSFWRPRVSIDWAPYRDGRWVYTPSGMTWVSYEPWGWVPHHYGTWDRHQRYGWVWYPGRIYRPAWVYWYWGTDRVGWCPTGYYTRYYGRHHYGRSHHNLRLRVGVYGWAGGHHRDYQYWTFVGSDRVYDRHLRRHLRRGHEYVGRSRSDVIPRGLITTDTRGLRPETVRQPRSAIEVLEHHTDRDGRRAQRNLPDLTDFVARRDTRSEIVRVAMPVADDRADGGRAAGTRGRTDRSGEPPRVSTTGSDRSERRSVRPTDRTGERTDTPRAVGSRGDRRSVERVTGGGARVEDRSREGSPSATRSTDSPRRVRSATGGGVRTDGDRSATTSRRVQRSGDEREERPTATRSQPPRDRGRATTSPRSPSRDREIVRRVVEGSRPASREGSTRETDGASGRRVTSQSDSGVRATAPRRVSPSSGGRSTDRARPSSTYERPQRQTAPQADTRATPRTTRPAPRQAPPARSTTSSPDRRRSGSDSAATRSSSRSGGERSATSGDRRSGKQSSTRSSGSKESSSRSSNKEKSDRPQRRSRPN